MSAVVAGAWAAWVVWCIVTVRPPARRPGSSVGWRRRRPRWAPRVGTVAAILVVALVLGPVAGVTLAAGAPVVLAVRRGRARRAAEHRAAACVPELGELLRVAVASGLTPVLALEQVAEFGRPPGREAARSVLQAVGRGRPLGDALHELVERLGPTVRPVVDALAATERYGVALEPVLDAAVADLRRHRRAAANEAARRLPVTLSFPLVGCVLPAFALLTLAPLVAGAVASLDVPVGRPAPSRLGPPGPLPAESVPIPGGRPDVPRAAPPTRPDHPSAAAAGPVDPAPRPAAVEPGP